MESVSPLRRESGLRDIPVESPKNLPARIVRSSFHVSSFLADTTETPEPARGALGKVPREIAWTAPLIKYAEFLLRGGQVARERRIGSMLSPSTERGIMQAPKGETLGGVCSAQWPRVKAIFHQAIDRPAVERTGFIEQACHGDPSLSARLNRWWRATAPPMLWSASRRAGRRSSVRVLDRDARCQRGIAVGRGRA